MELSLCCKLLWPLTLVIKFLFRVITSTFALSTVICFAKGSSVFQIQTFAKLSTAGFHLLKLTISIILTQIRVQYTTYCTSKTEQQLSKMMSLSNLM